MYCVMSGIVDLGEYCSYVVFVCIICSVIVRAYEILK
jgi:hypothetical protein